jgi:hypothetical protein
MRVARRGHVVVGASILAGLACGAVVLAGAGAAAQQRKSHGGHDGWDRDGDRFSFHVHVDHNSGPVTSCNQIDVTMGRGEVARGEDVQTLPRGPEGLQVSGAKNGPVYVSGSDRADYQVTLCKFAAADTMAEAQTRVADLSLSLQNNRATVNGPTENGYLAYVIVETPRDARLAVDVTNGPLDLHAVQGHIVARTLNGPLAVEGCSGDIDLEAKNGPVTLTEASGRLHVNAQNGPLTVNLSGTDWQGTGLDAAAHNGPLFLGLPENYNSGVRVEISPNSPFACSATACRSATRNWDDRSRMLQFGPAEPVMVRLSATNGPVTIGSAKND